MPNIPVLAVSGRCLAETYERALIALYEKGIRIKTQYDKPGDPASLDCTMNMTVEDPLAEPMIHKAFPGGIEDLREYVMEVQGVKDHWVKNMNDAADTRWEYTYHGRLAAYGVWRELKEGHSVETGFFNIDQVEGVLAKLTAQPFTRQAQMITWMPNLDLDCYDPPCLQSIWYRILEDESGEWWLNCNIRFRSNDAWGANFMNMFGFTLFNRDVMLAELARRTGRNMRLGRMNWQADSFHIYGKDLETARQRLFSRIPTTAFEDRTYEFRDETIRAIYQEAEEAVREKIRTFDEEYTLRQKH
ncbi:MAG: thymidylate synthase [Kiritimatiellia bacterium]